MSNPVEKERVSARTAHAPAEWTVQTRPWRVFLLAVFAVIATTSVMGEARLLLNAASGHRYAEEVIRTQIASLHFDLAPSRPLKGQGQS
jgi:hypothetical protein